MLEFALANEGEPSLSYKSLDDSYSLLKAIIAQLVLDGYRRITVRGRSKQDPDMGQGTFGECNLAYSHAFEILRASADLEAALRSPASRARLQLGWALRPSPIGSTQEAERIFRGLVMTTLTPDGPLMKFDYDRARAASELERLDPEDHVLITALAEALGPICC
ncbi:MAG: hypothetical protein WDN67_04480 [Candidatus Moraniibacteriota bacterium]